MNADYWKLKIQALLYPYPPDFALDPNGAGQRAQGYLQSLGLNDSVPGHVEQAHEIAFGLDVPPFIRQHALPNALVLTHPLSGESESLKTNLSATQAHNAFQEALKRFSGLKYQKLFIALWRFLAEVVHKRASNPYWGLLPADPRVPDHSIWDHASLASAIAGTWDENEKRHKPALLLFTIGSVQEFLMTARRTQDLWMGSYLLSYLICEAIKVIVDKCGPDCLIYPDLRGQPLTDLWIYQNFRVDGQSLWDVLQIDKPEFLKTPADGLGEDLKIASFPNMFTAIVPEGQASQLAQEAVHAVHCNWKWIAANVRTAVEAAAQQGGPQVPLSSDNTWCKLWEEQVPDLIDRLGIFWVIYPLDRAPDKNEQAEKVQQAIKEFESLIKLDAGNPQEAFEDFQKLYERSKGNANIGMGYSPVSQLAAHTLTNRKNLRNFCQHEAPGEKCSLCGVRSALHPEGKGDYSNLRDFWEKLRRIKTDDVRLAGRIRRGERLCAVCLTRRLAWEQHFLPKVFAGIFRPAEAHLLFPSTSSIATASFKHMILRKLQNSDSDANRLRKAVEDYINKVKSFLKPNDGKGPYDIYYYSAPIPALEKLVSQDLSDFTRIDGEWLFDESFVPERIEREYPITKGTFQQQDNAKRLEDAKTAAANLRKAAEEILKIKPSKYYALIAMDGDHMGQWVSGQKGPELLKLLHPEVANVFMNDSAMKSLLCRQRPLGPTLHMALTAAQKNFALQVVRQIVEEEHVGKLIYAGGDDVLAFVPISELLPVLRKLRWLCSGEKIEPEAAAIKKVSNGFATRVNNSNDERRFMLLGSQFSLSAGVAIVHHTHPFSHAVEEAYRAMKEHAKEELGRNAFAIHLMKRSGEPLKVGAKWKLEANGKEFNTLEMLEGIVRAMQEELSSKLAYDMKDEARGMALLGDRKAQSSEIKRLVKRHVSDSTKKEALADQIAQLFEGLCSPQPAEVWEHRAWGRLQGLLLLARFLAQGGGDGGE